MEYLAIVFYIILFVWVISKVRFFRLEGLPSWCVYAMFGLKVSAGLVYYYIHNSLFPIDQTRFFVSGEIIYSSLVNESLWSYIRLVFGPNATFLDIDTFKYAYYTDFWSHSGNYAMVRFHAFCRLFSMGYFTVHIVFMAFLTLIGSLLFYKVLYKLKLYHPYLLAMLLFCIPSLIFWTSGVHKDGFIYFGLGVCLYNLYEFVEEKARWYHLFFLAIGIFLVSNIRFYLNVLLFPALAMLFYTLLKPDHTWWKFTIVYLVGAVIAIVLNALIPSINVYEVIATRQWSFINEGGGSQFAVRHLEPEFWSIFTFAPVALFNAIFRPLPWDVTTVAQMVSGVETGMLGLLLIFALTHRKPSFRWHPVLAFLLFYALSNLLLIGYLVSNSGTLVRYRATALSFLVLVVIQMIDFKRWKSLAFLAVEEKNR